MPNEGLVGKLCLNNRNNGILFVKWDIFGVLDHFDHQAHSDITLTVLVVFREAAPLCQRNVFRSCLMVRLCAASQDRQTDRQGISDVFTICSGRADMMGEDEDQRDIFMVYEETVFLWGGLRIYYQTTAYTYQREREITVKHRHTLCGTLSCLNLSKDKRSSVRLPWAAKPKGHKETVGLGRQLPTF